MGYRSARLRWSYLEIAPVRRISWLDAGGGFFDKWDDWLRLRGTTGSGRGGAIATYAAGRKGRLGFGVCYEDVARDRSHEVWCENECLCSSEWECERLPSFIPKACTVKCAACRAEASYQGVHIPRPSESVVRQQARTAFCECWVWMVRCTVAAAECGRCNGVEVRHGSSRTVLRDVSQFPKFITGTDWA
ncbi:hypothetical protein Tco_0426336 [Tanacetum coccineum]